MALMGLLMGTLVFGTGMFTGANRRAAATLIVTAVRKGLAHANTTGKPARLMMDMSSGRLLLEESSSSEALVGEDKEEEDDSFGGDFDAGASLLADAEAVAETLLGGGAPSGDGFSGTDILGQDGEKPGRELGGSIQFVKVHTENGEDPIVDGKAYLYFWPGGVTERAIIQIARSRSEKGMTVVVSPLTGRAEIKRGLVELPERLFEDDEEYSERDDE